MKGWLLIGPLTIALAMSSCSTIQHTATTAPVDTHVYNLTVAELDVADKKAEKTYDWKWNPFRTISLSREKSNVTASLLKDVDADVLVEPQFEIKRRGLFRGGSLTVTGFPAKYRNFHSMTMEEAEAIAISNGSGCVSCCNPCGATAASGVAPAKTDNSKRVMPVSIFNPRPQGLREATAGSMFVSLAFGATFGSDLPFSEFEGLQFSAMVGQYGQRWGKYAKLSVNTVSTEAYSRGSGYQDYTKTSAQVTIGAIYRASGAVGLFGGIGVGNIIRRDSYDYYEPIESKVTMPVELGAIVNVNRHFNCLVGVGVPTIGMQGFCATPMIGVGYTF